MVFVPSWFAEGGQRPTNCMSHLREILLWQTMVEANNNRRPQRRPRPRKPPIRIARITAEEEAQENINLKAR